MNYFIILLFYYFLNSIICDINDNFIQFKSLKKSYNVSYDHRAILINGKRKFLISGSIHYPRRYIYIYFKKHCRFFENFTKYI